MCDKKESTFFRDRILQISLNQILKKNITNHISKKVVLRYIYPNNSKYLFLLTKLFFIFTQL